MSDNTIRPVVLTIAGLDPSGGAGIVADIRTIAAFDCFPTVALTSLTFQNTAGVFGHVDQTSGVLLSQINPILEDFSIAAVKTGMLPTAEIVEAVADLCRNGKLPAPVVDPVMISTSGHALIDDEAYASLRHSLLPQARLVTPNIPEAERLAGFSIKDEDDMRRAAEAIRLCGARAVLVKGGHRAMSYSATREAVDVLVDDEGVETVYRAEYFTVGEVHGSGCTLSAAIAASLAQGTSLQNAVHEAKNFVTEAIRESRKLGHGARPLFGVR